MGCRLFVNVRISLKFRKKSNEWADAPIPLNEGCRRPEGRPAAAFITGFARNVPAPQVALRRRALPITRLMSTARPPLSP